MGISFVEILKYNLNFFEFFRMKMHKMIQKIEYTNDFAYTVGEGWLGRIRFLVADFNFASYRMRV